MTPKTVNLKEASLGMTEIRTKLTALFGSLKIPTEILGEISFVFIKDTPLTVYDIWMLLESGMRVHEGIDALTLSLYTADMREAFRLYKTSMGLFVTDKRYFDGPMASPPCEEPQFTEVNPEKCEPIDNAIADLASLLMNADRFEAIAEPA